MTDTYPYPAHFFDPLRRKIAIRYAQHEVRKLLPDVRDTDTWKSMDEQIGRWWDALSVQYFWNAIHGISMGFRLKSLVPWITSKNVAWFEREVTLDEVSIGWTIGGSRVADDIQKWLLLPENEGELSEKRAALAAEAGKSAPRDHFPVFVIRVEGALRVVDGNRRLLWAIVADKNRVLAFVGEPTAEPSLFEHWLPTQLLVDLLFWHKEQRRRGEDTTESTAQTIAELVRTTSAGRHEFAFTAIHRDDEDHVRLYEAVVSKLATMDVRLD